ncbi:hypothetical protein G6F43_011385 [Rhizopus delemar]|nr:hypothetical protein G6F43_011385 [Rhizopus delemar]
MDIQNNADRKVISYLAKYWSKADLDVQLHYHMETSQEHFKARIVGAVEAFYHICGWNLHRSSRGCVFIDISMPSDDKQSQLRPSLAHLEDDDTDIFTHTHLEKYLDRHPQLTDLTITEYFTIYRVMEEMNIDDEQPEVPSHFTSTSDRRGYHRQEAVTHHPSTQSVYQKLVPINKTIDSSYDTHLEVNTTHLDTFSFFFSLELPVWRTVHYNQTDGESFFYQNINLYYPLLNTNYEALKQDRTWKAFFFDICDRTSFQMPADTLTDIKLRERQSIETASPAASNELTLQALLQMASAEQQAAYHSILDSNQTLFTVLGASGTGKSYLLSLLTLAFRQRGITTVVLAPTGVAAYSANGQTIQRFFGITNSHGVVNDVRLTDFFKSHKQVVFLIDEFSIITKDLCEKLSIHLSMTTGKKTPFGGITTVFFGNIGQLPPVNLATDGHITSSSLWSFATECELRKVQRQNVKYEQEFLEFLAKIRINKFDKSVKKFIEARKQRNESIPSSTLRLFTIRKHVNRYNDE